MPIESHPLSHILKDQAAQEAYQTALRDDAALANAQNDSIAPIEASVASAEHPFSTDACSIGDMIWQGIANVSQHSTSVLDAFMHQLHTLPSQPSAGDLLNLQVQGLHFNITYDLISKVAGMSTNALTTLFRNQ